MKLPFRTLRICGQKWKIKLADLNKELSVSKKAEKRLDSVGQHAFYFGETWYEKELIRLNKDMEPGILGEVLLHEILHVLIDNSALRGYIGVKDEENVVLGLTQGLIAALRDNPKLLKVLVPDKPKK
jgi:AAA+ ATPase superfamily predicted ATPase